MVDNKRRRDRFGGILGMQFNISMYLLAILTLIPSTPFAQNPLPSNPEPADTILVQAWIDSSYEYSFSDPDKAIRYATQAIQLSRELDYKKGVAEAHGELGYAWSTKGIFLKAVSHFKKGIDRHREIGDTLGLLSQLNDLGTTYKKQSRFDKALEYYFESLKLSETIGIERGVSANLSNIGLTYFEMGEDNKALEFYTRAVDINKRIDNKHSLSNNYNNIGLLYGDQGQYEKSLEYHQRALKLRRELGYTIPIANSLNNIGRVYMQQNHHKDAQKILMKALEVNEGNDPILTSIIQENLAKTYISAGRYNKALKHAHKTILLSRKVDNLLGVKVGYELVTRIQEKLGNYKEALDSQRKLMALNDSLLDKEKTRQINELQASYEAEKREKEIALLKQEKQQETFMRNAFLAGLILVGVIGLLVYNRQKLKISKNRSELENIRLKEQQLQNDLEFRNKQLTTHTLHMVQKNETMKKLKESIDEVRHKEVHDINGELRKIENLVDFSFNLDEDWEEFRLYFEEVHTDFFQALKEQYPDLTPNEFRLAALAKLNLSIKESATIMGITPNSVKTARYRLRRKLGLQTEDNLTDFLVEIENKI